MCCSEPWKILHSITGDDSSDALSEEFVQDKDVIKVDDVLSLLRDDSSNLGNSAVEAQGEVYWCMTKVLLVIRCF